MKRIDQLADNTPVRLAFVYNASNIAEEDAIFLGLTGIGDDRRATFRSLDGGRPYEWDAYRYRGGWAFGTSAQKLRLLSVGEKGDQ